MSRTDMAGLQLNVDVVDTYLRTLFRRCKLEERLGASAPVYLPAVLEYLLAEILELSGSGGLDFSELKELKKAGVKPVLIHPLDTVSAVLIVEGFALAPATTTVSSDLRPCSRQDKVMPRLH
jgi:hypothetical protein